MIRNTLDLLFSRGRKVVPVSFEARRTQRAPSRSVRPDPLWDDASVGIFICGMGRGVYTHPLEARTHWPCLKDDTTSQSVSEKPA